MLNRSGTENALSSNSGHSAERESKIKHTANENHILLKHNWIIWANFRIVVSVSTVCGVNVFECTTVRIQSHMCIARKYIQRFRRERKRGIVCTNTINAIHYIRLHTDCHCRSVNNNWQIICDTCEKRTMFERIKQKSICEELCASDAPKTCFFIVIWCRVLNTGNLKSFFFRKKTDSLSTAIDMECLCLFYQFVEYLICNVNNRTYHEQETGL